MVDTADWTKSSLEREEERDRGWIKFAIVGVVLVAAVAFLLVAAVRDNAQFYLTVGEIQARKDELVGKDARVSGIVIPDSIQYDPTSLHLEFDILDPEGATEKPLRIVIDGEPLPDQMKDEAEAVVEGRLQPDGTFSAETLMMKCTSKYDVEVAE